MKTIKEPSRDIPVADECDVLVVGAGPAGFAAAIGAARAGCKSVTLIETFNCVGGMITAGMMSHFAGRSDSPLTEEILGSARARKEAYAEQSQSNRYWKWTISHETVKAQMLDMLNSAGVKLRLYTLACEPVMEGDTVKGVIIESKSGRQAILAKVTVDCSGDGDIAARAGAEYTYGRDGDHAAQPVTLMFRIGGVDYPRAVFPPSFETQIDLPKGEIQHLGKTHLPFPAGHVLLYPTMIPGEVCVNMTNVTGIDGTCAEDLTKAELTCRAQMAKIVTFLREFVPGYEKCHLVTSAQQLGVRETRHFKGLYEITAEDCVRGPIFDDWIATRNQFNFDIHNVEGCGLDKDGAQRAFRADGKYTIPYRACVPAKVDGLLLAGRDICGTHKAHSNYRAMPICVNMGQGVGVAAFVAARDGVKPRDVNVKEVQILLQKQGIEV